MTGGPEGLRVHFATGPVTAVYHHPGPVPDGSLVVPLEALAECEGKDDAPVTIQQTDPAQVELRWTSRGLPLVREFPVPSIQLSPVPEIPKRMVPNDPSLLAALHEATQTASKEAGRFATSHILLKGKTGELVGTDGRQLLIQGGFRFPWPDEVLVSSLGVFGCKELPTNLPVHIGHSDTHVAVQVGDWIFWLLIDREGRFPDVQGVIPKGQGTELQLDAHDAVVLSRSLSELPGANDDSSPVTVDLNGQGIVRARASGQEHSTELILDHSQVKGRPVRLCMDRQYLARAARLAFTRLTVFDAEKPIVCRDERRTYVWMPLGKDSVLQPHADDVHVSSASKEQSTKGANTPSPRPKKEHQPAPANAVSLKKKSKPEGAKGGAGTGELLEEAAKVRSLLRETLVRFRSLVQAIKVQRRQHRLVRSTLATLKQLQQVGEK
jgi:hypothetical protein